MVGDIGCFGTVVMLTSPQQFGARGEIDTPYSESETRVHSLLDAFLGLAHITATFRIQGAVYHYDGYAAVHEQIPSMYWSDTSTSGIDILSRLLNSVAGGVWI